MPVPTRAMAQWRDELKEALSFGTDHLSLYQLTIEPATPFAMLHRTGALKIPDEDLAAALYETTQEIDRGRRAFPPMKSPTTRAPGAESRHNLLYWRYGDYAGVGPGAHGRLDLDGKRIATAPSDCRSAGAKRSTQQRPRPDRNDGSIATDDAAREHLLMNLRLAEGIDLAAYRARWSRAPDAARIASLVDGRLAHA